MVTLGDAKSCFYFFCKFCDYTTSKKSSYVKHNLTHNHKKATLGDAGDANLLLKKVFACEKCNKKYMSRNGIWKHKKICNVNDNTAFTLLRRRITNFLFFYKKFVSFFFLVGVI